MMSRSLGGASSALQDNSSLLVPAAREVELQQQCADNPELQVALATR